MARKEIGTGWDRNNRNAMNDNFKELYTGMDAAAQKAIEEIGGEFESFKAKNDTNFLDAVSTVVERDSKYPQPENGDTVRVTGEAAYYRYETGRGWVKTDEYNPAAIDNLNKQLADKADAEDLQEVSAEVGRRAVKGEITAADMSIASDAGKIQPVNLSDSVKQMMTGETPVNATPENKSVTTEKGATGFIVDAHFSKPVAYSLGNKNLFDAELAVNGKGVSFSTGEVRDEANGFVQEFIPIKPSTTYTINKHSQLAFYDAAKNFISGIGNTDPLYQSRTFETPENAYFISVSSHLSHKNTYQLEAGSVVTPYEQHFKGGKLYPRSVKEGMIDRSVVQESNIQKRTIADESLKFLPVETERGKNLFDKNKVKTGVYVRFDTGAEIANPTYSASDFILIEPNAPYTIYKKDQLSFYDSNHNFISGVGGMSDYATVTSPANSRYMRISVPLSSLDLVQIEKGDTATRYERFRDRVEIQEILRPVTYAGKTRFNQLFKHVTNPFVKTRVKLVGDSITAGVGGSGYSLTGPFMFKDYRNVDRYENIHTATSWANSLKNYLEKKFNKDTFVDLEHEGFEVVERGAYQVLNANSYNFFFWSFPNLQQGKVMAKFSFYGDHFNLYHVGQADGGTFDVVVDGEVLRSVDTYSATSAFNVKTDITGLALGEHTVELRATNNRNASATGKIVRISGLEVPKHVEVRNWGISGIRTLDAYFDRTKLIESSDDIVFIQLGTNDRIPDASVPKTTPGRSKRLLKVLVDRAKEVGADVYLMAAPPASVASETNPTRAFHMEDVHNYIKMLAEEQNIPFISHFQEFYQHIRYRGVTLDSLLADGLHPNDTGYDVMFKNIMQKTEIGLTYEGVPIE